MAWLSFLLAMLTITFGFLEFLVGDRGVQASKERLTSWYTYVGDGGLATLIQSAAKETDKFLSRVLGSALLSVRAIAVWISITCFLSIVVLVGIGKTLGSWSESGLSVPGFLGVAFLCDFCALTASRILFRWIARSKSVVTILWYLAYSYVAVSVAVFAFGMLAFGRLYPDYVLFYSLRWPLLFGLHLGGFLFILAPLLFSTLLFLSVLVGATAMQLFRKAAKPAAMVIIDRLATSKQGLFTAITGLLSAATLLVSALAGLLGH